MVQKVGEINPLLFLFTKVVKNRFISPTFWPIKKGNFVTKMLVKNDKYEKQWKKLRIHLKWGKQDYQIYIYQHQGIK